MSPPTRILRHPDFRPWIADLLSQLGGRLGMIAIPLLAVLDLNASALQVCCSNLRDRRLAAVRAGRRRLDRLVRRGLRGPWRR
ncbi:MAG TPA: hypothetical protein VGD71_40380 [Kribbella sp.]|jgi:hypothetical protein